MKKSFNILLQELQLIPKPPILNIKKLITNFVNVVPSKMIWVYEGFEIPSATCLYIC